jgi:crotonobetainyl-CoA:carnitine CoA-transferase CaiB-like acyl-CoA transferase
MPARASYTVATDEPVPRGAYPPERQPVSSSAHGDIATLVAWDDAWERLVTVFDTPAALDVEEFDTSEKRVAHSEQLDSVLNELLATEPVDHWLHVL